MKYSFVPIRLTKCSTQIVRGIGQSGKMDPQSTSRIGLRVKFAPSFPTPACFNITPEAASHLFCVFVRHLVNALAGLVQTPTERDHQHRNDGTQRDGVVQQAFDIDRFLRSGDCL